MPKENRCAYSLTEPDCVSDISWPFMIIFCEDLLGEQCELWGAIIVVGYKLNSEE
jgi:hypothetical protein